MATTSKFTSTPGVKPARKPRTPRVKPTVAHPTEHERLASLEAEHFGDPLLRTGIYAPTERRLLVATLVSLSVAALGGYTAAWVAAAVTVAALTLTGSAFLAIVAWFITAVLGLFAALRASNAAFKAVIEFDGTPIVNACKRGWMNTRSLFARRPNYLGGCHA